MSQEHLTSIWYQRHRHLYDLSCDHWPNEAVVAINYSSSLVALNEWQPQIQATITKTISPRGNAQLVTAPGWPRRDRSMLTFHPLCTRTGPADNLWFCLEDLQLGANLHRLCKRQKCKRGCYKCTDSNYTALCPAWSRFNNIINTAMSQTSSQKAQCKPWHCYSGK